MGRRAQAINTEVGGGKLEGLETRQAETSTLNETGRDVYTGGR